MTATPATEHELVVPAEPYRPPYWYERSWLWETAVEDWERLALAALRLAAAASLAGVIAELEQSAAHWRRKPYANAFVTPSGPSFYFAPDIAAADTPEIRRARDLRAIRFKRYDVAKTQEMLDKLAQREESTHAYLADLRADVLAGFTEVDELVADMRPRLLARAPAPPQPQQPPLPSEVETQPLEAVPTA